MTYQIPKEWKQCCTCEKWAGGRTLDAHRTFIEARDELEQGECVGGPWDRNKTYANHQCDGWIKWGQIS